MMVLQDLNDSPTTPLMPPLRRLLGVALLLGFLSFATRQLNLDSWAHGGITVLWPTNGFLIGILLCNPKRHWASYVVLGFLIDFAINQSLHDPFGNGLFLSSCNMIEVLIAAWLLFPTLASRPDLTQRKQLVPFMFYGVFLAPGIAALAASVGQAGAFGWPTMQNFEQWFTPDALGIAIVSPLCLAFNEKKLFHRRSYREVAGLLLLLGAVAGIVFTQTQFQLVFVFMPVLLLLGIRLGLAGSAFGLLFISILGGLRITSVAALIGSPHTHKLAERELVFQLFIAVAMLMVYIVEVVIAESQRLQASLLGSERRFRLLAEASRDIISLIDLEGVRHYVSPASVEVLGYRPDELLGGSFRELIHPDNLEAFTQTLADLREGAVSRPVEYRCRRADGSYIWLETNPRLYKDPEGGLPAGFVQVTRDISLRKIEEEQQLRAFENVEHLASSDSLTGIANRRHFDLVLEKEWQRAARERSALSLLLIDVDRFKPYNDVYGHLTGDECLRQVVAAIQPVMTRPADLLARYGGEEFVVVLPSTDAAGACQIAEWIRLAVERCRLPHPGNPPHAVITLSIGCSTLTPNPEVTRLHLLEWADQALYRAKALGRNRIHLSDGPLDSGSVSIAG